MSFFSFLTKSEEDLNAQEFRAKYKEDPNSVLLDVRTPAECKEGVIEGAQNIDLFSADFKTKIEALPKDKTYFVYCRSGNRSGQAVRYMKQLGFNAYNLSGGIMSWPY